MTFNGVLYRAFCRCRVAKPFCGTLLMLWIGVAFLPALAGAVPVETGMINVKDFGAVGDGKANDTEAIRAAVREVLGREGRYAAMPFIYFPEGTYRLTGSIEGKASERGWSGGWRAGMILWGDGPERTILKLDNNLPEFGDPQQPRPVVITGSESDKKIGPDDKPLDGGGNRAFRHGLYRLTVDVGAGNPGAVGVDYIVNNRGSIEDVVIRSSDPQRAGATGLAMTRQWPGPGLIKNVTIEGFDRGITTSHAQYSMTFENVTLRKQRKAGLEDFYAQALFFRNLTSENTVPTFVLKGERSFLTLLDSTLTGGDKNQPAIDANGAILYLRNVEVKGYGQVVAGQQLKAGRVEEYAQPQPVVVGTTNPGSITPLPIAETPTFWSDDADDFVSVADLGAVPGDGQDDWKALQAAIDSGKPIVVLPNGSYNISQPLVVRGKVRLLIGFQSAIGPVKGQEVEPLIRFETTDGPATLEHMWLSGVVEHASSEAVALRHVDLTNGYRNTAEGSGDVFLDDTIGRPLVVAHPQRFFGRQVNCEFGEEPLIQNHGGDIWILGYKTEGQLTVLANYSGRAEIVGGLFYPLRQVPSEVPLFVLKEGSLRLSYVMNGGRNNHAAQVARELIADEANTLVGVKQIPGRGPSLLVVEQK